MAPDWTTEGSSFPGVFRIKRGGDLRNRLSVTGHSSGDAENGVDFVQRPLSATIPAGEASGGSAVKFVVARRLVDESM